jgi:hypothetical protein
MRWTNSPLPLPAQEKNPKNSQREITGYSTYKRTPIQMTTTSHLKPLRSEGTDTACFKC